MTTPEHAEHVEDLYEEGTGTITGPVSLEAAEPHHVVPPSEEWTDMRP